MQHIIKYVDIPRIVPANARLPTSAPFDLARDIVANGKNIDIFNSIRPRLLTGKTEMQVVARICGSIVSSKHHIHKAKTQQFVMIKIVPFLLGNAFIAPYT